MLHRRMTNDRKKLVRCVDVDCAMDITLVVWVLKKTVQSTTDELGLSRMRWSYGAPIK